MQDWPADEDGLIKADPAHTIAVGPMEPVKAVGTVRTPEAVAETMAKSPMPMEASEVVKTATTVEAVGRHH